jgi:carbonic anhydrase
VDSILPGLVNLDEHLPPEAMLAQAVEANVRWSMSQILDMADPREHQSERKLVGAIYKLETGCVRFLE